MSRSIALRAAFRYLLQHPWLTALSVLGIALGVSVVVSIDMANAGAMRAFHMSSERVAGRATHHIVGPDDLDADLYRRLRVEHGIRPSAPIVEGHVSYRGRSFQLLGIDPFADRDFRPYTRELSDIDLAAFLGESPAVLVSSSLGLSARDTLHLEIAGRHEAVEVAGLLVPVDETSRDAIANLIIADIGTAHRLLGMRGRLSRIDLILEDAEGPDSVLGRLPPGVRVIESGARTKTLEQMTDAFELNLTALSLLSLVVATFLIYNAMTFSIVQRRTLIGRFRAIGVTRREIFAGVMIEAAVLGLAGSVVGLALGTWLAQGLVRLVTQTINDLYFVLEVRSAVFGTSTIIKGLLLGTGATLLAAVVPAREAAGAPVGVVLQRSEEERRIARRLPKFFVGGTISAVAGTIVLLVSGRNLTLSYAGLVLVIAAFALLTPTATRLLASAGRRVLGALFGLIGRMSAQGIIHNLSRTSVAIAALAIAVAAAIGVGTMVESFRRTVSIWLEYTLQADLYIQAPGAGARLTGARLDEELRDRIENLPGVRATSTVRRLDLVVDGRHATLSAIEPGPGAESSIQFARGDAALSWRSFVDSGAVLVSEPFAFRHGVTRGDSLTLPTDGGPARFQVAGVFYDYSSDAGIVSMTRPTFERYYDAPGYSGISVYAAEGIDLSELEQRIRNVADGRIAVRSNRGLREASLEVFDRTFAITVVLRVLVLIVAFGGIVCALMALQIERSREFAVLRAEGLTPGQLRRLLTLQTGTMGAIAGALSIPLGLVLAVILVYVINKRSFGWSLSFTVPPETLLESFVVAIVAAIIAGLYPSWRLSRSAPGESLRAE